MCISLRFIDTLFTDTLLNFWKSRLFLTTILLPVS